MSDDNKTPLAASVRDRLFNLTKTRGEFFDLILVRYALERFLFRLSITENKSEFILKGAMLFQIWSDRPFRPTRDLDLLAVGEVNMGLIAEKIKTICEAQIEDDGLFFDLCKLTVEEIREDDRYGGVRAKFTARLGSARIPIQIDFGIGDAVTPPPIESEYPSLLNMPHPVILAYPRETVIAEKLEAIVELGVTNSRMKDYFDLWFLATTYKDDFDVLALALKRTFDRRHQSIPQDIPAGLSDDFAQDPAKQKQWSSFQMKVTGSSGEFIEIVMAIRAFAMPVFEAASRLQILRHDA